MDDTKTAKWYSYCQNKVYQEVIHIDDAEVAALFMEKHGQNPEEALAYLSQWDYGEESDKRLTYSQIMDGLLFVNYAVNDLYLALWQTGIDSISLYRVVTGENSNYKEDRNEFI